MNLIGWLSASRTGEMEGCKMSKSLIEISCIALHWVKEERCPT